jgi:hypothetical protein
MPTRLCFFFLSGMSWLWWRVISVSISSSAMIVTSIDIRIVARLLPHQKRPESADDEMYSSYFSSTEKFSERKLASISRIACADDHTTTITTPSTTASRLNRNCQRAPRRGRPIVHECRDSQCRMPAMREPWPGSIRPATTGSRTAHTAHTPATTIATTMPSAYSTVSESPSRSGASVRVAFVIGIGGTAGSNRQPPSIFACTAHAYVVTAPAMSRTLVWPAKQPASPTAIGLSGLIVQLTQPPRHRNSSVEMRGAGVDSNTTREYDERYSSVGSRSVHVASAAMLCGVPSDTTSVTSLLITAVLHVAVSSNEYSTTNSLPSSALPPMHSLPSCA